MRVLVCPLSDPGYLYPALAVGRELAAAGHQVQVIGNRSAGESSELVGLDFVGAELHEGSSGFRVGRWFLDGDRQFLNVRRAAADFGPDVLLTSALSIGALLAGEVLDLPVVVLGLATHIWDYDNQPEADPQPRRWRTEQLLRQYHSVRDRLGLRPRPDAVAALSGAGLLLRGDISLEHPDAELPAGTVHVGPCDWEPPADTAELARLDQQLSEAGKPIGYVHLGRMFGGESLWPRLNAAFTDAPMRAVVELGRSGAAEAMPAADLHVLRRPWLGPLVERAELVLTSGTSAPTLAALQRARPLVMAPAGSEQPLLTEACLRAGVATRLPSTSNPLVLQAVLDHTRADAAMAEASARLAERLRRAPGAVGAAAVVTQLASTGRPSDELAG